MTDENEQVKDTASDQPQQTQQPQQQAVKPDVIASMPDAKVFEDLTKSINELQQMQRAIYEQQNVQNLKGVQNEEEKLKY